MRLSIASSFLGATLWLPRRSVRALSMRTVSGLFRFSVFYKKVLIFIFSRVFDVFEKINVF